MSRLVPDLPTESTLKMPVVLALCGLYLVAEVAVWFAFVPHVLSVRTFAWLSVLALMTTVAAGATMAAARATRSVAHVLYDVEHPARLPKL